MCYIIHADKAHEPLCHYLRISQHVTRLMLTLESLQQEDKRISTNLPFDVVSCFLILKKTMAF